MSMNWSRLTGVPVDDTMPPALREEGRRINGMIGTIAELRDAADARGEEVAQARKANPTVDRSPYYSAILSALRAEMEALEPLEIFRAAIDEWRHRARMEAEKRMETVLQAIRLRLGIPDGIETPIACLQNDPTWWAARTNLDRFPAVYGGYSGEAEAQQSAPARLRAEIHDYEQAAAAEAARVTREAETALEMDRLRREREELEAGQRDECLERQQEIDRLLTEPDRPKGRKRHTAEEGDVD